jgi:hypothetical protein
MYGALARPLASRAGLREACLRAVLRRWAARGLVCLLLALRVDRVRAEQAAPSRELEVPVLVVDSAGVDDIELPAALRELCGRVGIRVAAPFEAVSGEVLLLAHIRAAGDELELRVEDAETHRTIGERIVPRAESQAIARETLAHVLLGLVEPWIERTRRERAERAAAAPVQQLPSAILTPATPIVVTLGLSSGAVLVARDHWGARVLGNTALMWSRRLQPTLALDLHGSPPVSVSTADVAARFWLLGARLRGRLNMIEGSHGACDVALSVGADLLGLKPTGADPRTRVSGLRPRAQPVFGAAIGGRIHLSRRIALVLGVGVDVDPQPRIWQVRVDEDSLITLLHTSMVRPYALLGLDFVARAAPESVEKAP